MQCLFRKNKETNQYFQNVETICIKVEITYPEVYLEPTQRSMMEVFCKNKWRLKAQSTMFDSVLSIPLVSSLFFSLEGISSNKTTGGEYDLIIKALERHI